MAAVVTKTPVNTLAIFVVEWAGQRLSGGILARITEFSYEAKKDAAAECSLTITGSAGEAIEKVLPRRGDKLRVRWGYIGQIGDTDEMVVHAVSPSYGAETKFKVVARDKSSSLGRRVNSAAFKSQKVSDVLGVITKRNHLTLQVPEGKVTTPTGKLTAKQIGAQAKASAAQAKLDAELSTFIFSQRTDQAVLRELAHLTGCEYRVKGNTLIFAPPAFHAPVNFVFRWRNGLGTLIAFDVKDSSGGHKTSAARGAKATGVDPKTGKPFSVKANDASEKGRQVLGKEAPQGGDSNDGKGQSREVAYINSRKNAETVGRGTVLKLDDRPGETLPTPTGKKTDATRNAKAAFGAGEKAAVTASMRLMGMPSLKLHSIAEVQSVDARSAGKWRVTGVSHKVDNSGYFTGAEVERHGQNKVDKNRKKTGGQPSESKPGEPDKPPRVYARLNSKNGGAIVGYEVR